MSETRAVSAELMPLRIPASSVSAIGRRPGLDGIRALAVLAVIAYHLGYGWAPGGFVGVDIFFVLSGYLITSLLLSEHSRTGHIALREFWFRRARRLLPALFVMLIAVGVWVGLTAPPFELLTRRDDLISTLLYGSNWHFILSGQDYFAQYASASPLRHTWSLAIEEQFYIVWPLVVAGTLWIGRRRRFALAAICVAGIAVSVGAMGVLFDPADPSRAYYGTDARMHQLLIGALLAILMRQWGLELLTRRLAPIIAPLALVVLVAAFATVGDQWPAYYLGLSVILATSTAALVWAVEVNPQHAVARGLSLAPVAWIGRISYGLYLWHWPVILAITVAPGPLAMLPGTLGLDLARIGATFGIAMVSYYILEQPLQRGRMPVVGRSARRLVAATAASFVVVAGVTFTATAGATPPEPSVCPPFKICVQHEGPAGAPVVALIGDSIARSLDLAFVTLAEGHGWTYVLQANPACRVDEFEAANQGAYAAEIALCVARTRSQQDTLVARWHPRLVVMADLTETTDVLDDDGHPLVAGSDAAVALTGAALADVARRMTADGGRFAILMLPPRLPPECGKASNFDTPTCTIAAEAIELPSDLRYHELYDELADAMPRVSSISITSAVCPQGTCTPLVDGVFLRYDGTHFTTGGARAMGATLDAELAAVGAWR